MLRWWPRRGAVGRHTPGSAAYAQQPAFLNSGGLLQLRARRRQAVRLGTINGRGGYLRVPVPPGTSVCDWPARFSAGGLPMLR
jgi:hypothetical protein